jgi:hypothetical protein
MATTRTQVRDSVLAVLNAAIAAAPAGILHNAVIESSRIDPMEDSDPDAAPMPTTLLVYAPDKADQAQASYGMAYIASSTVTVRVEAFVTATTSAGIEAAMDAMDEALDSALLGNQAWLDTLTEHPHVTWQYLLQGKGGRYRGLVMLALSCRISAEVH